MAVSFLNTVIGNAKYSDFIGSNTSQLQPVPRTRAHSNSSAGSSHGWPQSQQPQGLKPRKSFLETRPSNASFGLFDATDASGTDAGDGSWNLFAEVIR